MGETAAGEFASHGNENPAAAPLGGRPVGRVLAAPCLPVVTRLPSFSVSPQIVLSEMSAFS